MLGVTVSVKLVLSANRVSKLPKIFLRNHNYDEPNTEMLRTDQKGCRDNCGIK